LTGIRAWVAVRMLVWTMIFVFPRYAVDLVAAGLTRLDYAHGLVKGLLIVWHSLLLKQERALLAVALTIVAAALVPRVGPWRIAFGTAVVAVGVAGAPQAPVVVALLAAFLLPHLAPARSWEPYHRLAWIPGTELVAPGLVFDAIGLPRLARAASIGGAALATAGWLAAECWLALPKYEAILFAPWPDSRVDPRVRTIERAPPGVKCDYHDIDVLVDRAVVVAEGSLRLLNLSRDGTLTAWPLTEPWGRFVGLAMDSETDALSGITWYLSGPQTITGVRWADGWTKVAETPRMPLELHHTYMQWLRDREQLFVFTIGTHNIQDASLMIEVDTPDLRSPRVRQLRMPDGGRPPTTRDVTWVPPLDAFVLAPDFGDQLLLAHPGKATVEPWLSAPTLNGRISWVSGLDRLLLPMPDQPELWIIDPKTASVERRFPTQPGVRTAAVDVARGLVLTASVITGQVLVQDLDDAHIVDRFGTVMPMVRNLELVPDRGIALLSTWTALYCIPYAGSCE
jgi:hypothetical protein